MSYSQNWVENQPTTGTLANTIWQYWQNNQIAIRERIDGLFGTTSSGSWATATNYQAASFDMRGSSTPRIFGGATNWGVTANDGVTDNFVVANNGAVQITGSLTVLGGTLTGISSFVTASTFSAAVAISGAQSRGVPYNNGSVTGATAINLNNGNNQHMTLTGNATLTFSNAIAGSVTMLKIKQDATGSRVPSLSGVVWFGGAAPTWTTTANYSDFISLYYDGTNLIGFVSGLGVNA